MLDTNALSLVTRAMDFAARAHCQHRRKGKAAEPYINHLTEVADLVGEATDFADPIVIAAGLLHDTLEDCPHINAEMLTQNFGPEVTEIVIECTDDMSLSRLERKAAQIAHVSHLSPQAKLVKLADKISNLRAIHRTPPTGWSRERKTEYLEFGQAIYAETRGLAESLDVHFNAISQELSECLSC